jgi:hypothetical protein
MINVEYLDHVYIYNKMHRMPSCSKSSHSPRLDTILMVEHCIQAHSGEYKRRALWENLPKKMMYQTFKTILDYLEESGKIAADREGEICWIHNPDLVRRYAMREDLRVR